ncbi:MAG: PAS domain S-box protein [Hylemonella sp.]|uniref:PAS domain-containing protein n=1 Tax=Hylemonella sp. TaxID=2066020 RepID=UPI0022BD1F26|nr:PAS domain S-box protein [Hylemonella sp.]MCZ8253174.1 PAS domain S-box protein [Hylemonella sp.]
MSTPTPESLAAQILHSMPEAVIFSDLEGIVRVWNSGAEKIFGWTAEEAIGQSLDMIIPERMRKAHWDGFNQAIARGGVKPGRTSMITRSLHKTEEFIYIDMSFEMVHDAQGEMLGSLAVARDATKRFNEEKALRKQLAELTAPKPAS